MRQRNAPVPYSTFCPRTLLPALFAGGIQGRRLSALFPPFFGWSSERRPWALKRDHAGLVFRPASLFGLRLTSAPTGGFSKTS